MLTAYFQRGADHARQGRSIAPMLLAVGGFALAACVASAAPTTARAGDEAPAGVAIANVDREVGEFLSQAEAALAAEGFDKAADLLESVLGMDKRCFAQRKGDVHRFVGARELAREMIGHLPREALDRYARRFFRRRGSCWSRRC